MKITRFETWKRNKNLRGGMKSLINEGGWQKFGKEYYYNVGQKETPKEIVSEWLKKYYSSENWEYLYTVSGGTVNDDSKMIEMYYREDE